jgi:hypothetical protein
VQERFRLSDEEDEDARRTSKSIFLRAARKVTSDAVSNARIQAVVNYYKNTAKYMDRKEGRTLHLTEEQYLESEVDWMQKDMDAWRWMCKYWASPEFQKTSAAKSKNRKSKPGKHTYGADGHIGLSQRMVCTVSI